MAPLSTSNSSGETQQTKACGGTQQTNAFRAGSHEDHRTSLFSAGFPMAHKKGGYTGYTLENQRLESKNGGFFIQMIFLLAIFRWHVNFPGMTQVDLAKGPSDGDVCVFFWGGSFFGGF